jgi:hypothetical protein
MKEDLQRVGVVVSQSANTPDMSTIVRIILAQCLTSYGAYGMMPSRFLRTFSSVFYMGLVS